LEERLFYGIFVYMLKERETVDETNEMEKIWKKSM
jgi:hypothetical protein